MHLYNILVSILFIFISAFDAAPVLILPRQGSASDQAYVSGIAGGVAAHYPGTFGQPPSSVQIPFTADTLTQLMQSWPNTPVLIYHNSGSIKPPCIDGQYIHVHFELPLGGTDIISGSTYGYEIYVIFGAGYFENSGADGFQNWRFGPTNLMERTGNFVNINNGQDSACTPA